MEFNLIKSLAIFIMFCAFLGIVGELAILGYAFMHSDQILSSAAYDACKAKAGVMGDADALKKCEDVKPK